MSLLGGVFLSLVCSGIRGICGSSSVAAFLSEANLVGHAVCSPW